MGSKWSSALKGVNISMRAIPVTPMFWAISTAFVLQGVIIYLRGPLNGPLISGSDSGRAPPKSHTSLSTSDLDKGCAAPTAQIVLVSGRKNKIMEKENV